MMNAALYRCGYGAVPNYIYVMKRATIANVEMMIC